MLSINLLEILVCPSCHNKLNYNKTTNELVCKIDGVAYPIENDIPILLEQQARKI